METDDVFDVDNNHKDPQFCATLASDIYKHLRIAEVTFSSSVYVFYYFRLLVVETLSLPFELVECRFAVCFNIFGCRGKFVGKKILLFLTSSRRALLITTYSNFRRELHFFSFTVSYRT